MRAEQYRRLVDNIRHDGCLTSVPLAVRRPGETPAGDRYVILSGKHREYKGIFYRGNRFWAAESRGTESLPTVILDALVLRGIEDDSEVVARLATSAKFRSASMAHKTAILERHVDVARLFGPYTWDTLPTRYLAAYTTADKLKNMDAVARQRASRPWPGSEA